jgi:four helix bundle protein
MNAECRMKKDGGMIPAEYERDLKKRTKQYALRIIRLYSSLDKNAVAQVLGRQMLRSGTSVGAHYREATRGRSVAEFVSKMEGGLQELDETAYWLELLIDTKAVSARRLGPLMDETEQLLSIFVASVKTSKQKRQY